MKKLLIALLLFSTLAFVFAACGDSKTTTTTTTEDPSGTTPPVTTTKNDGTTTNVTTTVAQTTPPVTTTEAKTDFVEAEHITLDGGKATVKSLNGALVMSVWKNSDGKIVYSLAKSDGKEIIEESEMGVSVGSFTFDDSEIVSVSAKELDVTYSYLGSFSSITDNSVAATIVLEKDSYEYKIEIKLYDNGTAFRYVLPKKGSSRLVKGETTSFKVANLSKVWCGIGSECYESVINSYAYSALSTSDKLNGPITIELKNSSGYVVLLEGYVDESYIGTNFVSKGSDNTFAVSGSWTGGKAFDTYTAQGDVITGWRMVNYAEELGDIVTNCNVYNTALGMDGKTTEYTSLDWMTVGKCSWSWINDRGVPFEPQLNYTLNAARMGFAYNIIDEGYTRWDGNFEEKLATLGELGKTYNVKQILWCAVPTMGGYQIDSVRDAEEVLEKIASLNLSGIKLDFFGSEALKITYAIQRAALEEGIKNELIVNFHGVHKPISLSVLYPNELTREAIRGLENMSREDLVNQAKFFTSQFYTRLLSGHGDFTPDVNTAMQIASLVVLDSPLMVIATDPVDIMANKAYEMIKAIPTVWDRTVFLDGEIGSYVSVAKEKDGVWFIGGISAKSLPNVKVSLSEILGEGEYMLTCWRDKTKTIKEKTTSVVTKDSVVTIGNLTAGTGYVIMITKLDISQHGGEIKDPITVTTASSDSVVKYTVDGTDPATSATAITCNGTITLTDSALLRVKIVSGDGVGTELSYQFNVVDYNSLESNISYNDSNSVVTLTASIAGSKIYYTLDGSEPSDKSQLYSAPITLTKDTTVKAIAISESGSKSLVLTADVSVRKTVTAVTPDIYLGSDYKEAVAGWNNLIRVNKSMNDTTLSLGGTTSSNGTKFEHGLSTNAIGYFVYDIPENVTRFVGIAGIDDSTYNNTGDGHKASIICTIYIDGNAVYTTQELGQGDYEAIDITIPSGAKEIKIHFGDAGDGITCDNADIVEAGFIR